jgi:hypothetical protein
VVKSFERRSFCRDRTGEKKKKEKREKDDSEREGMSSFLHV